jgi:hypothetical protein
MRQPVPLRDTPIMVRGREYAQIREPTITVEATELPAHRAQGRADIQAVIARFRPDGWKLVGVYPAEPGVRLWFERPVC